MSTEIAYAAAQCVVRWEGLSLRLNPGDPWDASDPFVRARPDLFSEVPTVVNRTSMPIEQATASPGERRMTKRG